MNDAIDFGWLTLLVAVVGLGAVVATRVAVRLRVPAPPGDRSADRTGDSP